MGVWSRLKSIAGGDRVDNTLAAATTINVPDSGNFYNLTGTATVTALLAGNHTRNRLVVFFQSDSGTTTFTNTNDTTTAGEMDTGGSNLALGQGDMVGLWLKADGAWVRAFNANN